MGYVQTSVDGFVGMVCLDHFAKRNALSSGLCDAIIEALNSFAAAKMRVALLRAKPGVRIWSAGHDVDELPDGRRDPLGWDDPLRRLIRAIESFPAPVIAMLEGAVWGGGCEVALACDIAIAAPNVTFALTPARLGVPYNISGMLTFLNSASLRLIKEMAFTAKPVSAERALAAGLVNHVVAADELEIFHGVAVHRDRRERAAVDFGDERRTADACRRAPLEPARLRARPRPAPHRLR